MLKCSVCKKEISYEQTNQLWITARVGTDTIPMLANLCSDSCKYQLPTPPENYIQFPHKGGAKLIQPPDEYEFFEIEAGKREKIKKMNPNKPAETTSENDKKATESSSKLIKLVRKIWEK